MKKICVGDRAPDFSAVSNTGQVVRLVDYLDQQAVVLFFFVPVECLYSFVGEDDVSLPLFCSCSYCFLSPLQV